MSERVGSWGLHYQFTGGDGTRTRDLLHAMQTRSRLRHAPGISLISLSYLYHLFDPLVNVIE